MPCRILDRCRQGAIFYFRNLLGFPTLKFGAAGSTDENDLRAATQNNFNHSTISRIKTNSLFCDKKKSRFLVFKENSMRSQLIISIWLWIGSTSSLFAQQVSKVEIEQKEEELLITFDLSGPEEDYLVSIAWAADGEHYLDLGKKNFITGKCRFRVNEPLYGSSCVFRVMASDNRIKDIDGNRYKTVQIGKQLWMKENLKVSTYRNGDAIATNLDNIEWANTTSGACAVYNKDAAINTTYGKLYNWYAVADPRGLCPAGWHVPSDGEWTELEDYLGGRNAAGGKLKAVSSLWSSPNTAASNSSGFSALPGGFLGDYGYFYSIGYYGCWWSSTETSSTSAWSRELGCRNGESDRSYGSKHYGFSVRCLRD